MTHADVAKKLVANLQPGVFAHAARNAVIHQDFTWLQVMLPGVRFRASQSGPDAWQLAGQCVDGSTVLWAVGG
jgi:hypothetical protein